MFVHQENPSTSNVAQAFVDFSRHVHSILIPLTFQQVSFRHQCVRAVFPWNSFWLHYRDSCKKLLIEKQRRTFSFCIDIEGRRCAMICIFSPRMSYHQHSVYFLSSGQHATGSCVNLLTLQMVNVNKFQIKSDK